MLAPAWFLLDYRTIAGTGSACGRKPESVTHRFRRSLVMRSIRGGKTLQRLGIVSTLIDAAAAFARRDTRTGFLLLGAAVASRWVPGLGVVVSVSTRFYRRIWRDGAAGLGDTVLIERGVVPSGREVER